MEFPPRTVKNKAFCCVSGCSSKACRDSRVRFNTFPAANTSFVTVRNKFGEEELIDRQLAWMKALKISKVTKHQVVCSLHFTENDYIPSSNPERLRFALKKISVPSCNLPETLTKSSEPNLNQAVNREERRRRRSFKMGKKRSLQNTSTIRIKSEVKEEPSDNEVSVARDRLKGALRELSRRHSDEGSSADSGDESSQDFSKTKKLSKPSLPPPRKMRRRKQLPADQLFHHTYVMKLFDRSVDLAQFREDTPLYPICRAWLANQPRNQNLVPKVRTPSPEIVNESHQDDYAQDSSGDIRDVHYLPPPLPREEVFPKNRIPSPIPQPKDKLDLNYDGQILKSKETLMKSHRAHWASVRRKWHQQAQKNEKRFYRSANILSTIFKRAQTEFE